MFCKCGASPIIVFVGTFLSERGCENALNCTYRNCHLYKTNLCMFAWFKGRKLRHFDNQHYLHNEHILFWSGDYCSVALSKASDGILAAVTAKQTPRSPSTILAFVQILRDMGEYQTLGRHTQEAFSISSSAWPTNEYSFKEVFNIGVFT